MLDFNGRWSLIAGRLPGRTDNEIKNYWNTNLGKKTQSRQTPVGSAGRSKNKPAVGELEPPTTAVIRTKATRCSKVFISPTPDGNTTENISSSRPEPEFEARSMTADISRENMMETGLNDTEDFPMDFMVDINMGELCLSDLLNSNFYENGNHELSGSSVGEPPLMISKEMLEDWSSLGCYNPPQLNVGFSSSSSSSSNLNSFGSLFDSGGDWFGE